MRGLTPENRFQRVHGLVAAAFPDARVTLDPMAIPVADGREPSVICGMCTGTVSAGRGPVRGACRPIVRVPADFAGDLAASPLIVVDESAGSVDDGVLVSSSWDVQVAAFIQEEAEPLWTAVSSLLTAQAPWTWGRDKTLT